MQSIKQYAIYQAICADPDRTIQSLYAEFSTHVSRTTFHDAIRNKNIKKWKKLQRPLLLPEHAQARLRWAERYKDWTAEDWKKVV